MGLEKVTLGVCALAFGLGGNAWAAYPNYIVIVADDFGSDKMPAPFAWDGEATSYLPDTDTLTALGNAGLRFTNAWANPVCSPTRASLNTGNYAWRSNIGVAVDDGSDWLGDVQTLPGVLQNLGSGSDVDYQTALFGKWHLGESGDPSGTVWTGTAGSRGNVDSVFPPPRAREDADGDVDYPGYDYYDGFIGGGPGSYDNWKRIHVGDDSADSDSTEEWWLKDETEYPDDVAVEQALIWIAAKAAYRHDNPSIDHPWLAVVTLAAPRAADLPYDRDDAEDDTTCTKNKYSTGLHPCVGDGTMANPYDCEDEEVYQILVECMDERIGIFLGLVAAESYTTENTVVVFMGDNGTPEAVITDQYLAAGDHEVGKGMVYQSGVRVPFIMADFTEYASAKAGDSPVAAAQVITAPPATGTDVTALVHTWDLYATMIEAAGGTENVDGISLDRCFISSGSNCASTMLSSNYLIPRFHYAETFVDENPDDATMDEGLCAEEEDVCEASVGVMVGSSEYSMIARFDPDNDCMNTYLYRLAESQQQTTIVDRLIVTSPTYSSIFTQVRGKFATAIPSGATPPGWMPRKPLGDIKWCSCSKTTADCGEYPS